MNERTKSKDQSILCDELQPEDTSGTPYGERESRVITVPYGHSRETYSILCSTRNLRTGIFPVKRPTHHFGDHFFRARLTYFTASERASEQAIDRETRTTNDG